jgi:hypothetical protein
MVVSMVSDFKIVHPVHYWVRVFCFAFSIVFLLLWADGLAEDARADVDIFDINDGTEDLTYGWGDDPGIGITPSNRWYFPFVNSDGDFNVSWSDNNGTSWSNVTVQSEGWKGETKMSVVSIQCWSNNTTCVLLRTEGADNAHDAYLFWLWGENDASDPAAWNYTSIRGGATTATHFSMIFNRTGTLYVVWNYINSIRYRLWDITTGSFGADTQWLAVNGYPAIQCDHNNNVWIAYQQSATSGNLWIRDFDQTESMTITDSTGRNKWGCFFITADNTKVLTGHYQYLSTHQFIVTYETVTNTTLFTNLFNSDTDDWDVSYWSTGNVYGDVVSVIQLRQETGTDEFVRFRAQYDAVDATWEGSETVLWTVPTDTDICYHYASGPNSVWPKIDNVSVSRLLSGDIHYWNFKDELGATDDWYDIVYTDSPVFTYWDWAAPAVPGGSNETTTEYNWTWWGDASCLSSVMIIAVVLLVGFIVIQATTRR